MKLAHIFPLWIVITATPVSATPDDLGNWTGPRIMQEVQTRQHQYPYVYEEQSIVLVDRNGFRDTRTARLYSRIEADDSVNLMLIFESPLQVKGVSLLARRSPTGVVTSELYLPSMGQQMIASDSGDNSAGFMGTDFSVESLTGEMLSEYFYVRSDDLEVEDQLYFSVDVFHAGADPRKTRPLRRHFIRQDNFFITRTDHFDATGEVTRRQRSYDLKVVDGTLWHANLMLMDDFREQHQTLIKVDRRIFSRDYVPAEMFSAAWLFENYQTPPVNEPEGMASTTAAPATGSGENP